MTNRSNRKSRSSSNTANGGTITKVAGEVASVAPGSESPVAETTETEAVTPESLDEAVEQTPELAAMIAAEDSFEASKSAEESTTEVVGQVAEQDAEVIGDNTAPAESPAPETDGTPEVAAAPVDIFADLPLVKIEDYEMRDLSSVTTSDPRKYAEVQRVALEEKLATKKGWKYNGKMITRGSFRKEFKPSSVHGTIDNIVGQYGRAGVPSYVLVAAVRQAQIGNKRSHYCDSLPPIGWAEGWIDSYISKGHGKIMEKAAPALTMESAAEANVAAEKAKDEIAKAA